MALRLLPPGPSCDTAASGAGTRLVRELKGPLVEDLGSRGRPVEALPVRDASGEPGSARVHRGPGFGVRRRDRVFAWSAAVALAAAIGVSAWVVLA